METPDMNMTNDSNLTTTFGSSAGGLIAFDAIFWTFILTELAELWYLIWFQRTRGYSHRSWVRGFPLVTGCGATSKTAYARVVTGVIVTGMIVALLTLVVGGVLSAQNGAFTDTPEPSAEGFTGRVLLILSAVVQLLVWTVAFVAVVRQILGCTCVSVCTSVLGSLFAMLFGLDGAFLSWSSFKFDTVQVINDGIRPNYIQGASELLRIDQNSSISTATPGPNVVELITFAALSWCTTLPTPVITWFFAYWGIDDRDRKKASKFSVMTAIIIGIPPLLLVAGGVLSLPNGDFTDTPGLSTEGITGRVLLILSGVISMLVWAFMFTATMKILLGPDGKYRFAFAIAIGCMLATVFVIGVVLLGWSSFEFDTIQINGTNSTVTPGLLTAGVVISSVGLGVSFLISFIIFCMLCGCCISDAKKKYLPKVTDWFEEKRKNVKEAQDNRLRLSKSLLEEALKHGFVECRTVVCLLFGVAGAGKTHTKHLLFGWPPPVSRNSTPLAVRPVHAVRVLASTQGGQLQEVDPDQLDQILASAVATGVPLEKVTFFQDLCCIRKTEKTRSKATGITPPSKSTQEHSITANQSSETTSHSKRSCYCCNGPDSELQQTAKAALDETAHQIANICESQQLLNGDWIYLIDSGGQTEFLDVLPAFLQHTSVCLFVMKLSEKLSEHPKIEYFVNGKPVGEPVVCPFTNEQMLMRCVQTVQSQCIDQVGGSNKGSQLVMVGTHQDLESKCPESKAEKNQRLQSKLSPAFDQCLVYRDKELKELIFPINAKTPHDEDHEVASEITEVILNATSSLKPRKTPISWFKFEQLIQKLARDYDVKSLHREECLEVARSLHLSKATFDAALDHLASFGVIHYYPHLLPDIVFVDPQLLLNKISELVKYHYQLRHESDSNKLRYKVDPNMLRKFRNEGCITLKLLKQFPEQYTNYFTPADFLKLMSNRLVVTHLINDNEYFMPCLLRTMESQEINKYRATTSHVASLAIHFSCGLVPHGIFCSLVAFLRSQSSPWKLSLCPEDKTKPLCLTRNCIKFQLPEGAPGSLTLIDAFSHFEVHVNAPHDTCVSFCPLIWDTLCRGIQKTIEILRYLQLAPKLAFLCKCEKTQPHLALPADAFNYWTCELNPDTVYGHLTPEHWVWCPEKGPKEVQLPLETSSEVEEGLLMEEAQPKTASQKHKRIEAPKANTRLPLEAHSGGLQAPTEAVKVIVEEPFGDEGDCPTLVECIRFRGRERMINIAEKISTKYYDFGLLLLDDPNGTRVRNMELKYREDAERINKEILQEWATGKGKKPVGWETLTEVLRDIELCTLASEIEAVKLKSTTSL